MAITIRPLMVRRLRATALVGDRDVSGENSWSWSSSDPAVAKVLDLPPNNTTAGCFVEGVAAGSCVITATTSGVSGTLDVTVIAGGHTAVQTVTVTPQ